MKNFIHRVNW